MSIVQDFVWILEAVHAFTAVAIDLHMPQVSPPERICVYRTQTVQPHNPSSYHGYHACRRLFIMPSARALSVRSVSSHGPNYVPCCLAQVLMLSGLGNEGELAQLSDEMATVQEQLDASLLEVEAFAEATEPGVDSALDFSRAELLQRIQELETELENLQTSQASADSGEPRRDWDLLRGRCRLVQCRQTRAPTSVPETVL